MRCICGLLVWGRLQTSVRLKSGYSDDRNLRISRPWITFWLSRGPLAHSWLVGGWVGVMLATTVCWAFPCAVTQRVHSTVCCYHQGLVCWSPVPEPWGFDPVSGPWVCPLSSHLTLRQCLVFLFPCTLQALLTEKATQIQHSGGCPRGVLTVGYSWDLVGYRWTCLLYSQGARRQCLRTPYGV